MIKIYNNIELFYQENPERKKSKEVDFGVSWKSIQNKDPHRISWVEQTGEFYVVNLRTREVQVANLKAKTRKEAEEIMNNWTEKLVLGCVQDIFPEIVI